MEKVFALFFCPFLICRLLSFSYLPRAFLRATTVSRKEKGERGEKLTNPFVIPEQNVGLEVIHCEGVGVEGLRREGVSAAEGGGTLEGSWEGGVPATLAWRGGFLSCHP